MDKVVVVLTGDDAGHDELRRVRGWLQETAARWWVVGLAGGGAWFAGDEVLWRRSFGWWSFRPFPAAKEAGKKGGMIRGMQGF